jgi:hypothetical protein
MRNLDEIRPSWLSFRGFLQYPQYYLKLDRDYILPRVFSGRNSQPSPHLTVYNLSLIALSSKIRTQTRPAASYDVTFTATQFSHLSNIQRFNSVGSSPLYNPGRKRIQPFGYYHNYLVTTIIYLISGFLRDVNDLFTFLGCYAAMIG